MAVFAWWTIMLNRGGNPIASHKMPLMATLCETMAMVSDAECS